MEFQQIKEMVDHLIKDHYEDFVKALISVERGITNQEILDSIYKRFIKNDEIDLLHEDLDYIIYEVSDVDMEIESGL